MVATGYPNGQKTEVFDFRNPNRKCQLLSEFPTQWGSFGGLIEKQPIICGGFDGRNVLQDCFLIGKKPNNKKIKMLEKRGDAASVVLETSIGKILRTPLNETSIWIVGGYSDDSKSTEFIALGQNPVKGPDMPFEIKRHCMIKFDPLTIFIIGGIQDRSVSNKTWIVNPMDDFKMRPGPSLHVPRFAHACGQMNLNAKAHLVVAGGYVHDTVELLDPASGQGWRSGIYNTYLLIIIF